MANAAQHAYRYCRQHHQPGNIDVVVNNGNRKQLQILLQHSTIKKRLDEFKAELAAGKRRSKMKENIPFRIDEVRHGMPEAEISMPSGKSYKH
jgi:hypothetical protein